MNLSRTLKTFPLAGALAMGLALTPAIVNADDDDRGRHKDRYSHDGGTAYEKSLRKEIRGLRKELKREHKRNQKSHGKHHGHKHKNKHKHKHDGHKHNGHKHKHVYKYKHNGHKHKHVYKHNHRGHKHRHHRYHHYRYRDYDPLRFILGLHTDNFDIIFRD